MSSKSLKSEYAKWLWMLVIADLIVVLLFLVPGIPSGASLAELGNAPADYGRRSSRGPAARQRPPAQD